MPKKILLSSIGIVFFFLVLSTTSAQQNETNLDKAKGDYSFQLSKYQQNKENYLTARQTYLTFQSAVSKETALTKTKEMIFQIYDVYIAYLLLIKEYGNSFTWNKEDIEKDIIFRSLDLEVEFLKQDKKRVESIRILEETPVFANSLDNHIKNSTLTLVNNTLAVYEVAESEAVYEDFRNLSDDLNIFVKSRINEESYTSFFANWESEIADIKNKTETQTSQARDELDPNIENTKKNRLERVLPYTLKAKSELLRSIPLFEEILKLK